MVTDSPAQFKQAQPKHAFPRYDAVIIGASVAGCVCALALAEKNWRIAVIEKRSEAEFYKKVCTHIIHPEGVDILESFGLMESLSAKSAQATYMELNFLGKAVHFPFGARPEAANIERKDLDPLLRERLEQAPNIDLMMGQRPSQITEHPDHVELSLEKTSLKHGATNEALHLTTALLIGADGRQSATCSLAGGRVKQAPNQRVALFAYFSPSDEMKHAQAENEAPVKASQVWALDHGDEYVGYFPNKRHTLVSWYLSEKQYQHLKTEQDAPFDRALEHITNKGLTLGPLAISPAVAKRTAPVRSDLSSRRIALIGDAKLAADPLTGVGCTWAMGSAVLLAKQLPRLTVISAEENDKLRAPSRLRSATLHRALTRYNMIHALKYRVPSAVMTFMSLHGKWIYNKPIFALLSRLTR